MAINKDKLKFAVSGIVQDSETPTPTSTMQVEPTTPQDEDDLINTIEDEQLRAALRAKRMEGRGRPRKNTDKNGKRTDGYSRTSVIVNEELWAKLKEVAFRETLTMKEILNLALSIVVERYEAKHGTIVPHPEKYDELKDINEIF